MIEPILIEEIAVRDADAFWSIHLDYLIEAKIISDEEDILYFQSDAYRKTLERYMTKDIDPHHLIYFTKAGKRIGAAQYTTYLSEDQKCFILDFWIFEAYRGKGLGTACFKALEDYTRDAGARYYMLNSEVDEAVRFWTKQGFIEAGVDEYDMPLFVKR